MTQENIDIESVAELVRAAFQEYLDENLPSIKIEALNDQDFNFLASGLFKLNWDSVIADYDPYKSLDFGFSFKNRRNELLGAFISSYDIPNQTLNIYGVERFSDKSDFNQMGAFSFYIALIFISAIKGKFIKLIDVEPNNQTLRNYYKSFGFEELNESDFIISIDALSNYYHTLEPLTK